MKPMHLQQIDIKPGDDLWVSSLSASRVAAAVGVDENLSMSKLWRVIHGVDEKPQVFERAVMWGAINETDVVRKLNENGWNFDLNQHTYMISKGPFNSILVTPDAIQRANGFDGLEIKCPYSRFIADPFDIPLEHFIQIHMYMIAFEQPVWWYAVLHGRHEQLAYGEKPYINLFMIKRNDELVKRLAEDVGAFMAMKKDPGRTKDRKQRRADYSAIIYSMSGFATEAIVYEIS